jgi:3-dehydroquinate dehydratase
MIANLQGTPARFCKGLLSDSAVEVYTAKSDGRSVIMDVVAANTSSNQAHVYIYIGGSATSDALVFKAAIAASSYIHIPSMYQNVNKNESIYAKSDTASVIALTISGLERV